MPQPNDLSRSLVALDQNSTIIAVVELSQSSCARTASAELREVPAVNVVEGRKGLEAERMRLV